MRLQNRNVRKFGGILTSRGNPLKMNTLDNDENLDDQIRKAFQAIDDYLKLNPKTPYYLNPCQEIPLPINPEILNLAGVPSSKKRWRNITEPWEPSQNE